MHTQSFSIDIADQTIIADITDLAGQTNGSVLMRCQETILLITVVLGKNEQNNLPYLPLSVDVNERFDAAADTGGGRFMRREGQPSEKAILSAQIIDRAIRPLFRPTLGHDIQVVVTVLATGEGDLDALAIIGTSLALGISDIPWDGPIGAVRIAREHTTGQIVINPSYTARSEGNLDFEILSCGKAGTINMIEAAAGEMPEEDVIAVLEASTSIHQQLETFQQSVTAAVGKQKLNITNRIYTNDIISHLNDDFSNRLCETLFSGQAGKAHLHCLKEEFLTSLPSTAHRHQAAEYFEERTNEELRKGVSAAKRRPDGRDFDDVRPLFAQAGGVSLVLHGSGIFYCGDTHIFSSLTLSEPSEATTDTAQKEQNTNQYFNHRYNFPPFAVGETGCIRKSNRRMVGHGTLVEKALAPVIPKQPEFPYVIGLISETLSSNGSSSMGAVCASTLALLDGGVPLLRPVAGIAIGALIDDHTYQLLTDIQGPEEEHGDMDLQVAGTAAGITAMQMDVKGNGVTIEMLTDALEKAKQARLKILDAMKTAIAAPRPHISPQVD